MNEPKTKTIMLCPTSISIETGELRLGEQLFARSLEITNEQERTFGTTVKLNGETWPVKSVHLEGDLDNLYWQISIEYYPEETHE